MNDTCEGFTIQGPKYIGYWHVRAGDIKVSTERKPSGWHRFWFSILFGIKWIDNAEAAALPEEQAA